VLDASGSGRFFWGNGADSLLELHDAILQNGQGVDFGGAIHAAGGANVEVHTSSFISNEAQKAAQFLSMVMPTWRSTAVPSKATLPITGTR
jgi:hypothetical protein